MDRKKKKRERNVYQCFVFGPKNAGKSALLKSFIGRFFTANLSIILVDFQSLETVDFYSILFLSGLSLQIIPQQAMNGV